jgi:Mrp family chromosome partitioning ATPase
MALLAHAPVRRFLDRWVLNVIISLISQKGGFGKSAVARLLGVEFSKAGWTVKIADLLGARHHHSMEGQARPGRHPAGDCRREVPYS